jgi:CRISPR/Cas system-associated protein Csx1
MTLYQRWMDAKKLESAAVAERRELEDEMVKQFNIAKDLDGTVKHEIDGYVIRMEGRITKKIDADKLQVLAAEAGLSEHLASLFRWKPEINAKVWNAASSVVTLPLLGAITSTPGRPTFNITKD